MADIKCKPMPLMTERQIEKFWSKVARKGPDECWEWIGFTHRSGYGTKSVNGKYYPAHRLAFFIFNKVDPSELMVCHHCDNRPCCNPNHLFLGTCQDNVDDMKMKGRMPVGDLSFPKMHPERLRRGENHPRAKLRESDLASIQSMRSIGMSFSEISKTLNVSVSAVINAHNRKHWKHIEFSVGYNRPSDQYVAVKGERNVNAKLTSGDVLEIRKLSASGESTSAIASAFNVTISCVNSIKSRRRWKHI